MLVDLNEVEVTYLLEAINPREPQHSGNGPNHLPPGHKMSSIVVRLLAMQTLIQAEHEVAELRERIEQGGRELRREVTR